MSYLPPRKTKSPNPLARLHSPAVMILLVFLLVVYLVYILAENFGLEGEGGWLGEVFGATAFIAGIIVAAVAAVAIYFGFRKLFRSRRGESPWMENEMEGEMENEPEDETSTGSGDNEPPDS